MTTKDSQEGHVLTTYSKQRSGGTAQVIVVWASPDGTRCVLTTYGGVFELRLENDGTLLRQAQYIDIRPACEAARRWRVDWDIEFRSRGQLTDHVLCPECGDEVSRQRDIRGGQWFCCPSCGDAWTLDEAREIKRHQV